MKITQIIVLAVGIVCALVFGLHRAGVIGGAGAPDEVLGRKIELIDVGTLEIVEVTAVDFERRLETDPGTGYKIGVGGRILATPMTCPDCDARVPVPPEAKLMSGAAKCPKCGSNLPLPF